MKALMKMVLVVILSGTVSFDTVLAQPPKPGSQGLSVADTIKQIDQDWADAMTVVDLPRVNQIVADDWISGYPGHSFTKAELLDQIKSGKHKLETCEFGPRDVQVLGNVAVVQGSATETRIVDGQRSTFHVHYMDVWVKRGASWMVFRSHATKL